MTAPDRSRIVARFETPWQRSLGWITLASLAILVGVAVLAILAGPQRNPLWIAVVVVPALGALSAAAFFTIRRYDVTPEDLLVRRLGWTTRVGLAGLRAAEVDPEAMRGVRRTLGRGVSAGFFSTYASDRLGDFRAYGRQDEHAVVLRFDDHLVVVTPAEPERMAGTLAAMTDPTRTDEAAG